MDFNFSCKVYHTKVYTSFTKVVVLFSRKLTKLVSHFSNFALNFYGIYKLQAKHKRGKNLFARKTLKLLDLHKSILDSNKWAPTGPRPSQIYPQRQDRARCQRGRARAGKQVTQMCDSTHLVSVGHILEGRGYSGGRVRRSQATAAEGMAMPANLRPGSAKRRCGELQGGHVSGSMLWAAAKMTGVWGSPRRHQWRRSGSDARAGEGRHGFYNRVRGGDGVLCVSRRHVTVWSWVRRDDVRWEGRWRAAADGPMASDRRGRCVSIMWLCHGTHRSRA
jgi:hypothetical protein